MTKEVPLSQGYVALVDDADYEAILTDGPWHAFFNGGGTHLYARHSIDRSSSIVMHRFITGWPRVDHINGNGLDNRRSNLRPATASQNRANTLLSAVNRTGFKGIREVSPGRWRALCCHHHIGYYDTAEEAARAYDRVILDRYGEFARLNFPKVETGEIR